MNMCVSVNICVANCSQEILKSFFMYMNECELFMCLDGEGLFEFMFRFIKWNVFCLYVVLMTEKRKLR